MATQLSLFATTAASASGPDCFRLHLLRKIYNSRPRRALLQFTVPAEREDLVGINDYSDSDAQGGYGDAQGWE